MENEDKKAPTNIELIEQLKGSDELTTLLNNSNESYWKSNIGAELKQIYTHFDNAIEKHLGVAKSEDIKSSAHYEGFIIELVEARKELEALKGKGEEGNKHQTKLWNDKFNKLKGELDKKDKEILTITQKGFESNVSNQLDNFLVGKNFKPTYSEDDVRMLVNAKKAKIINNTRTLDNGKTAVYNPSEDKYYLDTLGEPLTPVQVAELEFSAMFHSKSPGGDTPTTGNNNAVIEGDIIAIDMNDIKSRGDFYDAFKKVIAPKGLASHDEKYLTIQRATMEHYKINALPLA